MVSGIKSLYGCKRSLTRNHNWAECAGSKRGSPEDEQFRTKVSECKEVGEQRYVIYSVAPRGNIWCQQKPLRWGPGTHIFRLMLYAAYRRTTPERAVQTANVRACSLVTGHKKNALQ